MKTHIAISILLAGLVLSSCERDTTSEESVSIPTPYVLNIPAGFPPAILPYDNPLTKEGVELGRHLFYDPILSSNGLSCSSCHLSEKSYSIPVFVSPSGDSISVPPLLNLAFNQDYLWEGYPKTTEEVCIVDFTEPFFDTDMPVLVNKLENNSKYPGMFMSAFGKNNFSSMSHHDLQLLIVKSVGQFIRTMISSDSRFDRYMRHQTSLNTNELVGLSIFMTEQGDCFHCHGYPLMTSNTITNTGLDSFPVGADQGLYNFTSNPLDLGRFSTPTLRNIELTAPYMHDGRYKTLEEVVEFYNSGVHQNSPNIDPIMTKPFKQYGLNLTAYEKQCLVDFLKTLTDTTFISNSDYQKP